MSSPIYFGDISGVMPGHLFESRVALREAGLVRPTMAGIDGNGNDGAAAIVLSGGYVDDQDLGDEIIYTGHGGRDSSSGNQVSDQAWDAPGNAGLLKSMNEELPVRVIRGSKHDSPFSPSSGYQYAGLFDVTDAWEELGDDGFKICRFRLQRISSDVSSLQNDSRVIGGGEVERRSVTVQQQLRDRGASRYIKSLYQNTCQVCGLQLNIAHGKYYSEGAHIRPIGNPHNGKDRSDNMLCLCPNHHKAYDKGGFAINDDLTLVGSESGKLTVSDEHLLDTENFGYHRRMHGFD